MKGARSNGATRFTTLISFLLAHPSVVANGNGSFDLHRATHGEAVRFAESLMEEARARVPGQKIVFHLYHIEGRQLPHNLDTILSVLQHAGAQIRGTLIIEQDYDRLSKETPFLAHWNLDSASEAGKEAAHLRFGFARQLFGLPYGLTFLEHAFKGDLPSDGPIWQRAVDLVRGLRSGTITRRFPHDSALVAQAVAITLGGMALLSLALLSQGFHPLDLHFLLPNAVVAAWVPPFVYFQREVASFRLQGRTVWMDRNAAPGEQIRVTDNEGLFATLIVLQEFVLNLLFIPAMFGAYTAGAIGNGFLNAFLGGYGSIFSEHWKGNLFLQAEAAAKRGDEHLSKYLARKAKAINLLWFMLVFPVLKNIEFITGPSHWEGWPFVLIGTVFFVKETLFAGTGPVIQRARNSLENLAQKVALLRKDRGDRSCSDLLVLEALK